MSTVAELLAGKERHVLSIGADATVYEAVQLMVEKNVGSLLVEEGGSITGIVTERD
jgi:CBS domain-containing protein